MSNIKKAFEDGRPFIGFITCGDPDLETTAATCVKAAVEKVPTLLNLVFRFSVSRPQKVR